jgi:hypothetical protein
MPQESDLTIVGRINVFVVLHDDGTHTAFNLEDVSAEAAVGYLQVVQDRLRTLVANGWPDDYDFELDFDGFDCPHCGEHIDIEEDDEDE